MIDSNSTICRIIQSVLACTLCFSMSFSFFHNLNDWQIAGRWVGMGVVIWITLLLWVLKNNSVNELDDKYSLGIEAFMLLSNVVLSLLCLIQQLGFWRNYYVFSGIGDFDNPAGLVSFLSLSYVFVIKALSMLPVMSKNILLFLLSLLNLGVVYMAGSRTGILALTVVAFLYLILNSGNVVITERILIIGTILLGLVLLTVLFSSKHPSTDGRRNILLVCFQMFKERPLMGYGLYGFSANYMNYQSLFLSDMKSESASMLADNVIHPLNEFVLVLVNWGIIGMSGLLGLIVLFLKRLLRLSKEIYPTVLMLFSAIVVLSFFSYPFKYPITLFSTCYCLIMVFGQRKETIIRYRESVRVVFLTMLILIPFPFMKWLSAMIEWKNITLCVESLREGQVLDNKDVLYSSIKKSDLMLYSNPKYRYSRAVANYYLGNYQESLCDITYSKTKISSYDSELLAGDIARKMNSVDLAELHYLKAADMCPSRIGPLYSLFLLYESIGDWNKMKETGSKLLSKPIKVNSSKLRLIRLEVRKKCFDL